PDPEILETDSGLRYIVVNSADPAGVSPEVYDEVTVHYDGRLAEDGTKFDSSYDRGSPATFPAGRLIPGWVEALGLMKPGDEWVLLIPSDLGYGAAGTPGGPIPPDADLVFRVELQHVIPGTPPPPPRETDADAWARLNPWPANDPDIVKTESGLQYVVLASGDPEGVSPRSFDNVVVYYEGRLADGTVFDSAFERGSPAVFPAGGLIPGWVEALALMRPGDRWMLNVPYQLAYGEEGIDPDIPPAADLTFEVELMDVLRND
ncbi:MAG: FKBP-type peptidyl-prolyl cis-trans isomerase, partial [Pseudomonadota bacterium]